MSLDVPLVVKIVVFLGLTSSGSFGIRIALLNLEETTMELQFGKSQFGESSFAHKRMKGLLTPMSMVALGLVLSLLEGCNVRFAPSVNASGNFSLNGSGSVSCSATGQLMSQSGNAIVLGNLSISIQDAQSGPFSISLNGTSLTQSGSNNYTYGGQATLTIPNFNASVSSTFPQITIADPNNNQGTCVVALTNPGSAQSSLANIMVQTVPSATVTVGSPITLTASDAGQPQATFAFSILSPSDGSATATLQGSASAVIRSNRAEKVVVQVDEQNGSVLLGSLQETLTFDSAASTGNLVCQVLHHSFWDSDQDSTGYRVGHPISFEIIASTSESLEITSWDPGEPWLVLPTFPMMSPALVIYAVPGFKEVQMRAQTSSGILCNGGDVLRDALTIF